MNPKSWVWIQKMNSKNPKVLHWPKTLKKGEKEQTESSKGSTIDEKLWEAHKWLEYVSNTNKKNCLRIEALVNFSFSNCFSLQTPKQINLKIINVLKFQKILVSILSWNQGNDIKGHLCFQIDRNLDHKCPEYGHPVTIKIYEQIMISLLLYGWHKNGS